MKGLEGFTFFKEGKERGKKILWWRRTFFFIQNVGGFFLNAGSISTGFTGSAQERL